MHKQANILVTGANGLLGKGLCEHLAASGYSLIRAVRGQTGPGQVPVGAIGSATNWAPVLNCGVDAVVHLAAKVHEMQAEDDRARAEYREVNTEGTLHLARQCAERGVGRFVFLSTVKVMGEGGVAAYRADDEAQPHGAYAGSKWEAEKGLREIAARTGMEVVVLRPPLVYGPGVKANFLRLMQLVERGVPLPFGAVRNGRSFVFSGNLIDAVALCLTHPDAAGKVYLVSDGEAISIPELIRRMGVAFGRNDCVQLPVPVGLMQFVGGVFGMGAALERLTGSFSVDSSTIRTELGWVPPYSMQEGLEITAKWYLGEKNTGLDA
ncbi:SDR family oxidoreductase [Chlorobium sp. N1]|nr:SDR family oxidoreductase [Chlorobium sp. N1]